MNLSDKDIRFINSKKYPGSNASILIIMLGIIITIAMIAASFSNSSRPYNFSVITENKLLLTIPLIYFGSIYGVSALLNRKYNIDIQLNIKDAVKQKLIDFKVVRRVSGGPATTSVKTYYNHYNEYKFRFDDGSTHITMIPEDDEIIVGAEYVLHRCRYSKLILDIELK